MKKCNQKPIIVLILVLITMYSLGSILIGESGQQSRVLEKNQKTTLPTPQSADLLPYLGDRSCALANATFTGENAGDQAGRVTKLGDINGDGINDFLISAHSYSVGAASRGKAYLFYGGSSGVFQGAFSVGQANATFTGENAGDQAGTSISGAGDVNNDGFADFLIGANQYGASDFGRVYLFYGNETLYTGAYSINQANATFTGESASNFAGDTVSGAGDVNNDGYDDFLIGTYRYGATYTGRAYLFYGKATLFSGDNNVNQANATFTGENNWDGVGLDLCGAKDVNGDGFDDFLIGAYNYSIGLSSRGKAYLFYGGGIPYQGALNVNQANATFQGVISADRAGFSMSSAGDVNGDGFGDFLIDADQYPLGIGRVYLIYGNGTGSELLGNYDLSAANATFNGNKPAAWIVAGGSDINKDGYADFFIGVDSYAAQNLGRAYLFYGNSSSYKGTYSITNANATFTGELTNDYLPHYIAILGDINKDGFEDFVIGTRLYSSTDIGRVYLFNGGGDAPAFSGQSTLYYEVGTINNNITWTITDVTTLNPTYTVYKNGSTWGTPNQSWTSGIPFNVSVDGQPIGDHNFTIVASDGYGVNRSNEVLVRVTSTIPEIEGPDPFSYELGTLNNVINWTITDLSTLDPRYSVYKNGSEWGAPNQSWSTGVPVTVNIDGLAEGDHNFTISVDDGQGGKSSHQVIVSVYVIDTNGIWQPISLGWQSIICKTSPNTFAQLLIQGSSTGAQIKITATTTNPTTKNLPDAVMFFSILYDGTTQIQFPVTAQFNYNESTLPSGVQESSLAVYHYENQQWVIISRDVKANYNTIVANCQSFSDYAIAVAPPQSSEPIDPVLLTWIISLIAIGAISIGCIFKLKKGKGGGSPGGMETFPELEFED